MAISENPKRNTAKDAKAERFIASAGKPGEDNDPRKPITLRVPAGLLDRANKAAKRLGINRTAFIVSALAREIERMDG